MKKLKLTIFSSIILFGLFFLFGPEVIPENFQPQELLDIVADRDVIIIFNSGGWGNTPLEKAEDFTPIIEGIQETLNEWGYNSVVIPYVRTKDNLFGKITGTREFFNSFRNSSDNLVERIEFLTENLPDKKVIIAGLSSGGAFVTETYEKISEETKSSVYTIAAGTPFWTSTFESENILQLNNNRKDSLADGDAKSLLFSLVKAPFKWIYSKINGQNLTFSQAMDLVDHNYPWALPEVNSQIVSFLENKFH